MRTLEKGSDRIQKICDALKVETLEPAKQEAEEIVAAAHRQAEKIIAEANQEAKRLVREAQKQIEQEKTVFDSSLQQAFRQVLESLRQAIEKKLFNPTLEKELKSEMSDPKVIANLINVVISALQKEGTSTDLAIVIPKSVSASEVNAHLLRKVLDLIENNMTAGQIDGGIQVKILDQQLTLDISDKALTDYLQQYLRKDFRQRLFAV